MLPVDDPGLMQRMIRSAVPLQPMPMEQEPVTFVFYAPAWRPDSAGIRAMHLLCWQVQQAGYRAFLVPTVKCPDYKTKLWDGSLTDATVAVYPEGTPGNPIGARTVARWLLNVQDHDFVGKDDLFFSWIDGYNRPERECHLLKPSVIDEDAFYPPADKETSRTLRCYWARKYRAAGLKVPEEIEKNCIDLQTVSAGDKDTLREIFQRSECLISFEQTSLTDEAMLCGCPTVYLLNNYFPAHTQANEYGIATSLEPDAIRWAHDTLIKRVAMYMSDKKLAEAQVDRFIALCEKAVRNG